MKDFNHILVVSRSTKHCRKAVHIGISMARLYGAKLHVLHVVHDPFNLDGWNLPLPSVHEEYVKLMNRYKKELHTIVSEEKGQGVIDITESVMEGDPVAEIVKVVASKHIDLMIMLGHEEGRIEHFLFGRTNDAILRKLPCSILVVKQEPGKND